MIYIVFAIILFIINLGSKLLCDLIKFKPKLFENGEDDNWWLATGKYRYDLRTVWTKGVLSFISDGWHFADAVRNMSFILTVNIVFSLVLGISLLWCIVGYAIFGLLFNLLYKLW